MAMIEPHLCRTVSPRISAQRNHMQELAQFDNLLKKVRDKALETLMDGFDVARFEGGVG